MVFGPLVGQLEYTPTGCRFWGPRLVQFTEAPFCRSSGTKPTKPCKHRLKVFRLQVKSMRLAGGCEQLLRESCIRHGACGSRRVTTQGQGVVEVKTQVCGRLNFHQKRLTGCWGLAHAMLGGRGEVHAAAISVARELCRVCSTSLQILRMHLMTPCNAGPLVQWTPGSRSACQSAPAPGRWEVHQRLP